MCTKKTSRADCNSARRLQLHQLEIGAPPSPKTLHCQNLDWWKNQAITSCDYVTILNLTCDCLHIVSSPKCSPFFIDLDCSSFIILSFSAAFHRKCPKVAGSNFTFSNPKPKGLPASSSYYNFTFAKSFQLSSRAPPLRLAFPLSRSGIETLSFDLRTQCLAFVIGLQICNSVLSSETLIHQFCFALKLGSSSQGAPWKVSLLSMDRSRGHFSKQLYFSKLLWETIFYLRTPL